MAEWFFMFFYRLSLLDKSTAWTVSSILPFYCLMFTRLLNVSSFSFTSTFKFLVVLSSDCDSPTWFAPSNCDPVSECVERTVIQSRHTQTHKKTADFRERCATEFIYTWEMFVLLSVFSAASTVFASRPGNVSPGGGVGSWDLFHLPNLNSLKKKKKKIWNSARNITEVEGLKKCKNHHWRGRSKGEKSVDSQNDKPCLLPLQRSLSLSLSLFLRIHTVIVCRCSAS